MQFRRKPGITLVEIIIAIAIAGILAILAFPKIISGNQVANTRYIHQVEELMQQMVLAVDNYEKENGVSYKTSPPGTYPSLEWILFHYSNYFAYKQITEDRKYFLFPNGSRLMTQPENFMVAPFPEGISTIYRPYLKEQWADPDTGEGYCGDYSQSECFYIDINGIENPNELGLTGDVVPLRIDLETKSVRTLFQWERALRASSDLGGITELCRFASRYDVEIGALTSDEAKDCSSLP